MLFDYVISLGNYCETAYQIRRLTGNEKAYFFDWLVTPADGLIIALESDFRQVFLRQNLELWHGGESIIDTATNILFHHDFSRDVNGKISPETIDVEYPERRRKIEFLIERWNNDLREGTTLFVWADNVSECTFSRVACALKRQFPAAFHHFLLILSPDTPRFSTELGENVTLGPAIAAPPGPEMWKGVDKAWDDTLGQVLAK